MPSIKFPHPLLKLKGDKDYIYVTSQGFKRGTKGIETTPGAFYAQFEKGQARQIRKAVKALGLEEHASTPRTQVNVGYDPGAKEGSSTKVLIGKTYHTEGVGANFQNVKRPKKPGQCFVGKNKLPENPD